MASNQHGVPASVLTTYSTRPRLAEPRGGGQPPAHQTRRLPAPHPLAPPAAAAAAGRCSALPPPHALCAGIQPLHAAASPPAAGERELPGPTWWRWGGAGTWCNSGEVSVWYGTTRISCDGEKRDLVCGGVWSARQAVVLSHLCMHVC